MADPLDLKRKPAITVVLICYIFVMSVQVYSQLLVWQKAIDLVVEVYRVCDALPKSELYGLAAQMKRAAVSIPSNIAEGRRRSTRRDFAVFIAIANGSLAELETQLHIAVRLGFLSQADTDTVMKFAAEVGKMLNTVRAKLMAAQG